MIAAARITAKNDGCGSAWVRRGGGSWRGVQKPCNPQFGTAGSRVAGVSSAVGVIALRASSWNWRSGFGRGSGHAGSSMNGVERCRRNRFTIRSSRLWKVMTNRRPPGLSTAGAAASAAASDSSSSFTAIRMAWNARVAGWVRPWRPMAVSMQAASSSGGFEWLRPRVV